MATIQFTISNIDLEEFSAKKTILKMSLGIILVFDLGKPETFQNLKKRMPEITQNAGFIPIMLMGTNKEAEVDGVMIPSMDIDQFMFKYGINHYFRVSTKTGEGIQRTFETLSDEIIKENIRKLGSDEVKGKTSFSFNVVMIGDKYIRKDWISEFGVQRFAAPSTMGGAISRKMIDRDIHHLFKAPEAETLSIDELINRTKEELNLNLKMGNKQKQAQLLIEMGNLLSEKGELEKALTQYKTALFVTEQLGDIQNSSLIQKNIDKLKPSIMEKKEEKVSAPASPPGAAPSGAGVGDTGFRDLLLDELKELKAKKELEREEEPKLEKPKPLPPMEFKKTDKSMELPEDLKHAIDEEVRRVRDDITGKKEVREEKPEVFRSAPPPPPSGPPSGAPKPLPKAPQAPHKAEPAPTSTVEKYVLAKDKRKKKAIIGRARLKSKPAVISEPAPVPIDEDGSIDEDAIKKALAEKTRTQGIPSVDLEQYEFTETISTDDESTKEAIVKDGLEGIRMPPPKPEMLEEEEGPPSTVVPTALLREEPEEDYGALAGAGEMEITTEKLLRKTTVFYRERMNPETLNKLAVILSSEKIYEKLKIKIDEIARAATDKALEIDKEVPIVEVIPEFPGCVCVPSVRKLNAEKEYDTATFLITPLQTGDIPDAKVKLYHKGKLIETIPCPTKVVKTTAAKISAGVAVVVPLLSQFPIIYNPLSTFLGGLIPFYEALGELDGIVLILTGLFALISGIIYLFKRPKDAKQVETFPELDEKLEGIR